MRPGLRARHRPYTRSGARRVSHPSRKRGGRSLATGNRCQAHRRIVRTGPALRRKRRSNVADKNTNEPASIGLEELLLLHSLDVPVSTWTRERGASGVMMIPVPSSGILESVQGEATARETPGITELLITARLHDFIEAWPEGASYLGFLFASAETPREVEQALKAAHAKLCFTITPRLPVQHPAQHASGKSAR